MQRTVAIRPVQRTIAPMTQSSAVLSGEDWSKYLEGYFVQGWTLFSLHVLGQSPDGTNVIAFLVKYEEIFPVVSMPELEDELVQYTSDTPPKSKKNQKAEVVVN